MKKYLAVNAGSSIKSLLGKELDREEAKTLFVKWVDEQDHHWDGRSSDKITEIVVAILTQFPDLVKEVLDGEEQTTALHMIAINSKFTRQQKELLVGLAIDLGADTEARDIEGYSPMAYAMQIGDKYIPTFMMQKSGRRLSDSEAALLKDPQMQRRLSDVGQEAMDGRSSRLITSSDYEVEERGDVFQ